jgi:hypothetical protein
MSNLKKQIVIFGKFDGKYKIVSQYDTFREMIEKERESYNKVIRKENKKRAKNKMNLIKEV